MGGRKSKRRSLRNLRPRDPGKHDSVTCGDDKALEHVKDLATDSKEFLNKVTLTRILADKISVNLQKASCIENELNYGKSKYDMPSKLKCLEMRRLLTYDTVGALLIKVRICLGEKEDILARLKSNRVFAKKEEQFVKFAEEEIARILDFVIRVEEYCRRVSKDPQENRVLDEPKICV